MADLPSRQEAVDSRSIIVQELHDEISELKRRLEVTIASHKEEMVEHRRKLKEETAAAIDRGVKRAESVAGQQSRARERQLVSQSAELLRLKKENDSLKADNDAMKTRLEGERRQTLRVVDEKLNTEATTQSLADQYSLQLRQKEAAIEELAEQLDAARQRELASSVLRGELEEQLQAKTQQWREAEVKITSLREEQERLKRKSTSNLQEVASAPGTPRGTPNTSSPSTSFRDAGSVSRDSQRMESLLRAKDKQVVTQSTEISRLRSEIDRQTTQAKNLTSRLEAMVLESDARERSLARLKDQLADAVGVAEKRNEEANQLRDRCAVLEHRNQELSSQLETLTAKLARLSELEEQSRAFRAAHSKCDQDLIEKDSRIGTLSLQVKDKTDEVQAVERDLRVLKEEMKSVERELSQKDDIFSEMVEKKNAHIKALSSDVAQTRTTITELRKSLQERADELSSVTKRHRGVLAALEKERDELQRKVAQTQDAATVVQQTAQQSSEQSVGKVSQLQAKNDSLVQELSSVEQQRRAAEAQIQALTADSSEKKTAIQKLSLELQETKQQYARLERAYQQRTEEVNLLVQQINDLEGNDGGGTTTTTKKLIGIIESISVEVCARLAQSLCWEYMRDAPRTTAAIINMYRLPDDVTADAIGILCRVFLCQKHFNMRTKPISDFVGIPEASLRRVVAAFSGVIEGTSPNERHTQLLENTPAPARHTYLGSERLSLLCCVMASASPIGQLSSNVSGKYCLALICSYLPIVIRGNIAFASHVMHTGQGPREGHTSLLVLSPETRSFTMMESQVTSERALVVIISGVYRRSMSYTSATGVKYTFQCTSKRDGACLPGKSATESHWEWSEDEEIPAAEATMLQYVIEYDRRHNGLLAVDARNETSYALAELSMDEVASIQELYGGALDLQTMCAHRSWREIPPPPSRR